MEIIESQLVVSFSLGANISKVSAHVPGGLSDGQWHEAELTYLNRVIKLFTNYFVITILQSVANNIRIFKNIIFGIIFFLFSLLRLTKPFLFLCFFIRLGLKTVPLFFNEKSFT